METKSSERMLKQANDFENISERVRKPDVALQGFLKVTQDGQSDVYDDNGNRLSFKNTQEMIDEISSGA